MTSPIVCTGDPDGAQRHAPYASVSCVRAKLRWPLSLGSRCRDYVRCVHVFACSVYSRVQPSLFDDLPVSSLHGSDPAWPPALTRGCTVSEHLLIRVHSRGSPELFSHTCLKAERRYRTRENNSCQHFEELVPTHCMRLEFSHPRSTDWASIRSSLIVQSASTLSSGRLSVL